MHGARGALRTANPLLSLSLAVFLGMIALAGCGSDSNPMNPGGGGNGITSSFSGTFSSGIQSGKLDMTINTTNLSGRGGIRRAARTMVAATGTADVGGSSVTLTGMYENSSNQIALDGGGYHFGGKYEPDTHGRANTNGHWLGPGGKGGSFICYVGSLADLSAYCGRFRSNSTGPDSAGTWTFGVVDSLLAGWAFGDSSSLLEGIFFEGKVSNGNPRAITINYQVDSSTTLFAPGTIDTTGNDTMTGTFTLGTTTGTYNGSLCP